MSGDVGWKDLMAAVVRIADSLDRLVTIAEDLSAVVELPLAADMHREVMDEQKED